MKVVSPYDGNTYETKNGKFARHLMSMGVPMSRYLQDYVCGPQICKYCGDEKKYSKSRRTFNETCGSTMCRSHRMKDVISNTPEVQQLKREKILLAKRLECPITKADRILRSKDTLNSTLRRRKDDIVSKRRATCVDRYGAPNFNNPMQISMSKRGASEERNAMINNKRRITLLERYGVPTLNQLTTTQTWYYRSHRMYLQGRCTNPDDRTEWEIYSRTCRRLTEQNYTRYVKQLDPFELRGHEGRYDLDHIIPIFDGFMRGIDPAIIAHHANLRMLSVTENRSRPKRLTDAEFEFIYQGLMQQVHAWELMDK